MRYLISLILVFSSLFAVSAGEYAGTYMGVDYEINQGVTTPIQAGTAVYLSCPGGGVYHYDFWTASTPATAFFNYLLPMYGPTYLQCFKATPVCTDTPPSNPIPSYQIPVGQPNHVDGSCDMAHVTTEGLKFLRGVMMVCNTCVGEGYDANVPSYCQAPKVQTIDPLTGYPMCTLPACPVSQTFDLNSSSCKCDDSSKVIYDINFCVADANGDGIADLPSLTTDTNGDGIPDVKDPTSPFYALCLGVDKNKINKFYGKIYSQSYYNYKQETSTDNCAYQVSVLVNIDGSYDRPDLNNVCQQQYCYVHDTTLAHSTTNPCDELYDIVLKTCTDNQKVTGYAECTHNGLVVTNSTMNCVDISTDALNNVQTEGDCKSLWYEQWNPTTSKCECSDGYARNKWGDCWKVVDLNATDLQKSLDLQAQDSQALTKQKAQADANTSASLLNFNSNIVDILSGIRKDLNLTNQNLNDLKDSIKKDNNLSDDLLAKINDKLTKGDIPNDALVYDSKVTSLLNTATSAFNTIGNDYTNMKNQIGDGFSMSALSSGVSPDFSFVVHDKTISLNLCTAFSNFYPIFYFIFSILFTILGLRFFMIGFTIRI